MVGIMRFCGITVFTTRCFRYCIIYFFCNRIVCCNRFN
jgi:hypothetical protein